MDKVLETFWLINFGISVWQNLLWFLCDRGQRWTLNFILSEQIRLYSKMEKLQVLSRELVGKGVRSENVWICIIFYWKSEIERIAMGRSGPRFSRFSSLSNNWKTKSLSKPLKKAITVVKNKRTLHPFRSSHNFSISHFGHLWATFPRISSVNTFDMLAFLFGAASLLSPWTLNVICRNES